jgi:hypothetical protein
MSGNPLSLISKVIKMINNIYGSGEMIRPENWETIQVHSERKPPAGCYIMQIINATVGMTKNNDTILRLELDIAEGEYKNYYSEISASYNKNLLLRYGQLCEKESAIPYFKKIITDIEQSNMGFKFNFNCNSLRGKYVGAYTYYEVYKTNEGHIREAMKIDKFISIDQVRIMTANNNDQNISHDKTFNMSDNKQQFNQYDDDLPF